MSNDPHDEQPDTKRLGIRSADPSHCLSDGGNSVGERFADPNSADDVKIGISFEETNSSARKHHRPVKDVISEPFRKPKSRKVLYWIVGGIVVLFLTILIAGWIPRHNRNHETAQRSKRENEDAPAIEVSRVMRSKGVSGLVVPGTTTPLTEASIYARANGYLKKRFVDIGDHVRKGQLLAIIDAPDLDQQVDQAREQLKQSEAQLAQQVTQLALTKVTTDRYRELVTRGVFSRQEGDQREADYQAQRANVSAAERNVEAFKANLRRVIALQSYERVTAPFDGIVTQRNVDTGNLISAQGSSGGSSPTPISSGSSASGSAQNGATNSSGSSGNGAALATPSTGGGGQGGSLFTIAQSGRLRILVSVPEGYAGMVKPGQHTILHFQEYPDKPFFGDVTRTAGSLDQNTRTLLVEVQVDNSSGRLLPGMYAVVTFAEGSGPGPLLISSDAVAIRKDQPTVAVISGEKIHLIPVTLGRDYGAEIEVVGGLHEGDFIASTFTDDVREGVKVKTHMDQQQEEKAGQPAATGKPQPPGGSTQYGDPGITDQDMQGQSAKPQQKQQGGAKKASGKQGSQQ